MQVAGAADAALAIAIAQPIQSACQLALVAPPPLRLPQVQLVALSAQKPLSPTPISRTGRPRQPDLREETAVPAA